MHEIPQSPAPYWIGATEPRHPKLDRNIDVEVAVIGAGITGVTTALLLQREGKRVALVDAGRVAEGVTGRTTAHATVAIDARYARIAREHGAEAANLVAEGSRVAIEQIERMVTDGKIDCGLRRVPGYLYTEKERDLAELREELAAARNAGVAVTMTRDVPLPFPTFAALRFENQAELDARRYVLAMLDELVASGGKVYEDTRVVDVEHATPCRVRTDRWTIRAGDVVEATHVPLNRVLLQTKIAHYQSYVLGLRVAGPRLEGIFWDAELPYHYIRDASSNANESIVLVGGEDHKTGAVDDTRECYARLLAFAEPRFDVQDVAWRWSAQVIEPVDGLPLIGRNSLSSRIYVATGFAGNGITFGTLAAIMLRDRIMRRRSPWARLFESTRVTSLGTAATYVAENASYPLHLVGDRLRAPDATSVDQVGRGEGKIVRVRGRRVAVFRGDGGELHALDPVCPHLGCHVHFNGAERTWDCPCHGSRFDVDGRLLNGPAKSDLDPAKLDVEPAKLADDELPAKT